MNESETRAEQIDPALKVAAWGGVETKDYADKLAIRFVYSANGQGIYEIDRMPAQSGQGMVEYGTKNEP